MLFKLETTGADVTMLKDAALERGTAICKYFFSPLQINFLSNLSMQKRITNNVWPPLADDAFGEW